MNTKNKIDLHLKEAGFIIFSFHFCFLPLFFIWLSIYNGSLSQDDWFVTPKAIAFTALIFRVVLADIVLILGFSFSFFYLMKILYLLFCKSVQFNLDFFLEKQDEIAPRGFRSLFSCIAFVTSFTIIGSVVYSCFIFGLRNSQNEAVLFIVGFIVWGSVFVGMWWYENLIRYLVERFVLKKPRPVERKAPMFRLGSD